MVWLILRHRSRARIPAPAMADEATTMEVEPKLEPELEVSEVSGVAEVPGVPVPVLEEEATPMELETELPEVELMTLARVKVLLVKGYANPQRSQSSMARRHLSHLSMPWKHSTLMELSGNHFDPGPDTSQKGSVRSGSFIQQGGAKGV